MSRLVSTVADVRTSDDSESLVLTPRSGAEPGRVRRAVREGVPDIRLHSVAGGVSIAAREVHLLPANLPGVDLRWTDEATLFVANRRRAMALAPVLREQVRSVIAGGAAGARALLANGHDLQVLDDHQLVNVAAMTVPGGLGLCVFDEQGAGKTVTTIFAFDVLVSRDEVDCALIVAPKSMVTEWPVDFARFMGDRYRVRTLVGSRRDKCAVLAARPDVTITNYETAVTMEAELRAMLRTANGRAVLIVDESFFVKNLDAQRTRALRRLREWCGRAFVLCGTPAPNAPHDVVQQMTLVDFGATFSHVDVPDDREAARPVIQQALSERGMVVRHLKQQVLPDLPAKRFTRLFIDLQPMQASLYDSALQGLVQDLQAMDEVGFRKELPNYLARRAALLQICSNPSRLCPSYNEVPAKLLAMDALLASILSDPSEKVVVWSFYTASVDGLMARYGHLGAVRYDGTVTDTSARRAAVDRFQNDNRVRLFIGNPAAAGAGLTLHSARYAVYESLSNQAAHYLQSLDRIHRRGQTRDVEYVVLLCNRTIESGEHDLLSAKEQSAQQLLGDEVVPTPSRDSFLRDATSALDLWRRGAE